MRRLSIFLWTESTALVQYFIREGSAYGFMAALPSQGTIIHSQALDNFLPNFTPPALWLTCSWRP